MPPFLTNLFRALGNAFHGIAGAPLDSATTDARNLLSNPLFGSKRFLLIVGFAVGIYALHVALDGYNFPAICLVVAVYLLGESYANGKISDNNGAIKVAEIEADKQIELAKIRAGIPVSTVVVAPPTAAP
jgi:hypothetical protein